MLFPLDEPSSAQDGHSFILGLAGPMGEQRLRVLNSPTPISIGLTLRWSLEGLSRLVEMG